MANNIQLHRPNRLSLWRRALVKPETVILNLPGHLGPVHGTVYRRRPFVPVLMGSLVLVALGGGFAALQRPTAPPVGVQSALPAPLVAHPVTGCVPDRVWVVASHVGGALHFAVNGQRVQSVYYGSGDAVGVGQTPRIAFNGPGFAQIDLMPFLHEGTNRITILAEHVKDREWAGVRVTMKKNERPFHTINQPFDRVGKGERTLYDQDAFVTVTKCQTQTAEESR